MRRVAVPRLTLRAAGCVLAVGAGLLAVPNLQSGAPPEDSLRESFPAVTNVEQLSRVAAQNPRIAYAIDLTGIVWWADPAGNRLVLADMSGAEELNVNVPDMAVHPGQRVRLSGMATIARRGAGFTIGPRGPVVDNNGVHAASEKSGAVYLRAGLQPFAVEWFNGVEKYELTVAYAGPDFARRPIPDSALFRAAGTNADGTTNFLNGLEYSCYEGMWEAIPDLSRLTAVKTGTVTNFDLGVKTREEHVALRFSGWLKIPRDGLYTFYAKSDDGSRIFAGVPRCRLDILGTGELPPPTLISAGQALDGAGCHWAAIEGTVKFASERAGRAVVELETGTGRMRVEIADGSGLSAAGLLNRRVRVTGVCQKTATPDGEEVAGTLLASDARELQVTDVPREALEDAGTTNLPELTTVAEVHRLKREEAQRKYPVRLRGVITAVLPEHQAFTIQDSTRGLYVEDHSDSRAGTPQLGEFLEVEGTTDPSRFAPIVYAKRVRSLGAGRMPEPVRPTWDQLMNGSLDAQYVEMQGIVTAVQPRGFTLFTEGGVITVTLRGDGMDATQLRQYMDALVRVRGCLFAFWDYLTHHVKMGEVIVNNAEIAIEQPAPADLFSTPAKTAADLLLFDPQAGVFQRVKVAGQIVARRDSEFFMMQDGKGVRFLAKEPLDLGVGDEVEAVGFPDLQSSASPVLREAVARKTGRGPLPEPHKLAAADLIRAENDATRVQVQGLLVEARRVGADVALEMQNGVRGFVARLNGASDAVLSLPAATKLELTGVYAARGWNRAGGSDIASFELLVNSPSDINVLARPPWWTLRRLLVIVGALACVLAATVLWITQLHRQVEERTAELGRQIQERQRAEHQRAMEQERARIAQDLHDELGSGITEISMLAARAKSASPPDDKRSRYLDQAGGKARDMVTALDEIVWAMNPRHDSVGSLVSYLSLYADRFLSLANIDWRLDAPAAPLDHAMDSRRRHQLFLAFKEALTNVVRHSQATEVRLDIQVVAREVRLSITDNGRGLPARGRTEEMNGVANMRTRLEKLGGRCDVSGDSGGGTVVRFVVPLN